MSRFAVLISCVPAVSIFTVLFRIEAFFHSRVWTLGGSKTPCWVSLFRRLTATVFYPVYVSLCNTFLIKELCWQVCAVWVQFQLVVSHTCTHTKLKKKVTRQSFYFMLLFIYNMLHSWSIQKRVNMSFVAKRLKSCAYCRAGPSKMVYCKPNKYWAWDFWITYVLIWLKNDFRKTNSCNNSISNLVQDVELGDWIVKSCSTSVPYQAVYRTVTSTKMQTQRWQMYLCSRV